MGNVYRRPLNSLITAFVETNKRIEPFSNETCVPKRASNFTELGLGGEDLPSHDMLKMEVFNKLGIVTFTDTGHDFHSDVIEETTATGTRQLLYNRLTTDKHRGVIEEGVVNFLDAPGLLPFSTLRFINLENKESLDLNRLLPSGCAFSPSPLLKVKIDFHRNQRRMTSAFFPVDLKTYRGANREGEFYYNREAGRVAYGNLTAKGGLLSLFHEMAHAWQFALDGTSAKKEFSQLFSFLSLRLHNLGVRMEAYRNQVISKEKLIHFIDMAKERLAGKGIALNTEAVLGEKPSSVAGSIVFTAHSGKKYYFKSRTFEEVIRNYMKAERDAWAGAIIAIRLLREKGFDLEPGLIRLKDFRSFIHPHLIDYCNSINSQIEINRHDLRLTGPNKPGR